MSVSEIAHRCTASRAITAAAASWSKLPAMWLRLVAASAQLRRGRRGQGRVSVPHLWSIAMGDSLPGNGSHTNSLLPGGVLIESDELDGSWLALGDTACLLDEGEHTGSLPSSYTLPSSLHLVGHLKHHS